MDQSLPGNGQPAGHVLDHREAGPTVSRMLVGAQLRLLREARGITREDAAYVIRGSGSKISRMELGRTSFKARDLTDLLDLYGLSDDATRESLLGLAQQAKAPGWWHEYADVVPEWFEPYLGLEYAASIIRSYDAQFIPGLLQIEEYARAIIRVGLCDGQEAPAALEARLQRCVELRMRRQRILHRPDPPRLWAVIDEAALRRPAGGTVVMRAQIQHLIGLAGLPHVAIQVLPLSSGVQAAGGGPFSLLRFPEMQLPDVVYLEQLTSALYPGKPADTLHYWTAMNRLVTEAEPPAATTDILQQIINET